MSGSAIGFCVSGQIHDKNGNATEAFTDWDEALRLATDPVLLATIHCNRIKLLSKTGNYAAAQADSETAIERFSPFIEKKAPELLATIYLNYARLLRQDDESQKSLKYLEEVVRIAATIDRPKQKPNLLAQTYCQEDVAVVGVDPIDVIAGKLPRRQRRLAEAWAELHQEELIADWERLQAGEAPLPIAPLE